jgi:GT2 family glycosyltransferase
MAVSVIVSNMNGKRFLQRLLETLRMQRGVTVQVIVVDRLSHDGSREYLAEQPDVTVVSEPPETGLVRGYAAGVAHARHEHLFFCNEDMWFDPDCLQRLEARIDPANHVIAADPWQWTYDGKELIHAGTRFRSARWNLVSPYPRRHYAFTEPVAAGELVPFPCAGAFLMHRTAYEAAGGWAHDFFLDHEDVDLFLRVWQCGGLCVSVPEARVYHAVGASNAQQIATIDTPVKRRRAISGLASTSVIGLKYFTGISFLYPWLLPGVWIAKDLLRLRLGRAWLAVLATGEAVRRLPAAMRFRSGWSHVNRPRPGQDFFRAPEFNAPCEPRQGRQVVALQRASAGFADRRVHPVPLGTAEQGAVPSRP